MIKPSMRLFLTLTLTFTLSSSCTSGGIEGTGISMGTITGFGSVFVNGVEFNTDDATILVDGQVADEDDLGIGMVVAVEGTFDNNGLRGRANVITYEELVEGTVDATYLDEETLVVLGQTILTNLDTTFDPKGFDSLELGNIVEVSGWRNSKGLIQATRIEYKSAGFIAGTTELEITGVVEALDGSAMTFNIGGLLIDYSTAVLIGISGATLVNGLLVEVESIGEIVGAVMMASEIEAQESIPGGSGGFLFEIEGILTEFTSSSQFKVNGIPVRTDDQTSYENGSPEDIALDKTLEVEGILNADGILMANEIDFELEGSIEIQADIQAVDTQTRSVLVLGLTVLTNNPTVIWDNSNADVQPFGLEDLLVGDRVALIGNPEGSKIIAIRIERRNPDDGVEFQGPVTAFSEPDIEIFGLTAITTTSTLFLSSKGAQISAAKFFSDVEIGTTIDVEGSLTSDNTINAIEIEFEN